MGQHFWWLRCELSHGSMHKLQRPWTDWLYVQNNYVTFRWHQKAQGWGTSVYQTGGFWERGLGWRKSPSPCRTLLAGLGDKRQSEAEKLPLGINVGFELMQWQLSAFYFFELWALAANLTAKWCESTGFTLTTAKNELAVRSTTAAVKQSYKHRKLQHSTGVSIYIPCVLIGWLTINLSSWDYY